MQLHQQFLIQLHWSQHINNSDILCSSSPITSLRMAQIRNFNDQTMFLLIEMLAVNVRYELVLFK